MAIRLEDQLLETKKIKSKDPTGREMTDMQRQHEQAMRELDQQMPPLSGKTRKFVFTR